MRRAIWTKTVFALGVLLGACAPAGRYVTLADGTKAQAAPTYLSAQEMAAKGKNSYGVPEVSFAFYTPGTKIGKLGTTGDTYEVWASRKKNAIAAGINSGCHGFVPAEIPSWDKSFCDESNIRHDCFRVERLFVVPWGSGGQAVGLVNDKSDPRSGWRLIPAVQSVGGLGSDIEVEDLVNGRVLIFAWNGQYIRERRRVGDEYRARSCDPADGEPLGQKGYQISVAQYVAEASKPGTFCRTWLPQVPSSKSTTGDPTAFFYGEQFARALTDCNGFTYPVPTQAGVEIYFYGLR